jgi:very-short-patch-repair endonuclease
MQRMSPLQPLAPPKGGRGVGERGGTKEFLRQRAKKMRHEPTPAEHRLWQILRAKRLGGFKFKRQLPIAGYIADFACLTHRLIVEADGGQHGESTRDRERDAYLQQHGFRVLRFWNNEIFNNEEGVLLTILSALEHPLPCDAAGCPPDSRKVALSRSTGEGLNGAPNA